MTAKAFVQGLMLTACHYLQVLWAVVEPVTVDVVDAFMGVQRTAQHLLGDQAMFKDPVLFKWTDLDSPILVKPLDSRSYWVCLRVVHSALDSRAPSVGATRAESGVVKPSRIILPTATKNKETAALTGLEANSCSCHESSLAQ